MAKYITNLQIQRMSFRELGKAVSSGALTEKRLKSYYTQARSTAMSRQRTVSKRGNEFGELQKESFMKLRNITNTQSLLHEIADVNKYLSGNRSTITGLKRQREKTIERAEQLGFDIDYSTYPKWIQFMNWFKNSEFAKAYDSSSEEVAEAFNMAEGATPEDWARAFEEFTSASVERKEY